MKCWVGMALWMLVALAGCERANSDEKNLGLADLDADIEEAYLPLGNVSGAERYVHAKPVDKLRVAAAAASETSRSLEAMWGKFLADTQLPSIGAVDRLCRPALDAALEYSREGGRDGESVIKGAELFSNLGSCREAAMKDEREARDSVARARLWRRFASAGMALLGMRIVSRGDEESGLKFWREGMLLVDQDRPGLSNRASPCNEAAHGCAPIG